MTPGVSSFWCCSSSGCRIHAAGHYAKRHHYADGGADTGAGSRVDSYPLRRTAARWSFSERRDVKRDWRELLKGAYTEQTPAAIVYKASWLKEERTRCPLGNLARCGKSRHFPNARL